MKANTEIIVCERMFGGDLYAKDDKIYVPLS